MNFFYPTADTFHIEYDEQRRAYVTLNGVRFGVQSGNYEVEWGYNANIYCIDRVGGVRLQFDLVELYEPPTPKKPKRSWATSMGLRRPS